jgi:hypothetical protein
VPVSSPSYFPPNSSTDQVKGINAGQLATGAPSFLAGANAGKNSTTASLIIIGDNSGKGGIVNANLAGTIIIGDATGQAFTTVSGSGNTPAGCILIGNGSYQTNPGMDSTIAIGHNIYPNEGNAGTTANVLIGNGIAQAGSAVSSDITNSVIIGHQAMPGCAGGVSSNVIIGFQCLLVNVGGPVGNVFIGPSCGATVNGMQPVSQNTVIGSQASIGTASVGNVVIGASASAAGNPSNGGGNIAIGLNANATNGGDIVGHNICIGVGASSPSATAGGRNVVIGDLAGKSLVASTINSALVVELNNNAGTAQKALFFGQFLTGNLIIGNSITGTSQDFGGTTSTNILKLLNGTVGNANPVGGGYFYVVAGVLHWVDSSGNDTTLSTPAAPTTGASTATFVATNKPGATTGAGPVAWENRVIDGVSYQSPLWAT